jgi:hypothetical protein
MFHKLITVVANFILRYRPVRTFRSGGNMLNKITPKILPIGLVLTLALLLALILGQTGVASGAGLFYSPLGPPVAPQAPPESPSPNIPLGKIPAYRDNLPIIQHNTP